MDLDVVDMVKPSVNVTPARPPVIETLMKTRMETVEACFVFVAVILAVLVAVIIVIVAVVDIPPMVISPARLTVTMAMQ